MCLGLVKKRPVVGKKWKIGGKINKFMYDKHWHAWGVILWEHVTLYTRSSSFTVTFTDTGVCHLRKWFYSVALVCIAVLSLYIPVEYEQKYTQCVLEHEFLGLYSYAVSSTYFRIREYCMYSACIVIYLHEYQSKSRYDVLVCIVCNSSICRLCIYLFGLGLMLISMYLRVCYVLRVLPVWTVFVCNIQMSLDSVSCIMYSIHTVCIQYRQCVSHTYQYTSIHTHWHSSYDGTDFYQYEEEVFCYPLSRLYRGQEKRGSVVTVDVTAHERKSSTEHGPTTVPVR